MAPYCFRNIIPRKGEGTAAKPLISVLAGLSWIQWAHYFTGFLAWTCDGIDFYSVSLSVKALEAQFNKPTSVITTTITLTLLFRPVGAAIFGILSDRFGRKWPLVMNLAFISILQLGAGFSQTFKQFLALRALFGIGMGGIWGLAAATALENIPVEARGIASGLLQQGYTVGSLLAACMNLTLVPETTTGWRSLFWAGSGISMLGAFIRAVIPESEVFLRAKATTKARGVGSSGKTKVKYVETSQKTKIFLKETKAMLKRHWLLCIYAVLLMTGFNFLSHGSQDLYPTYLQTSKNFSAHNATVATIIGNCGAIAGGVVAGLVSQYFGRRLTMVIFVCIAAVFIPLWILPSSFSALAAGAFCIQFGVQGAWGVIPIQLAEMSPPAFRATFPGVTYQLGNMASSAASQIEATGGNHLRTTIIVNGKVMDVPDYATVQGILIGVVAAWVIVTTMIGPENHGSHFEKHKMAFEEGAAQDDAIIESVDHHDEEGGSSRPTSLEDEKERSSVDRV